MCVCARVYSTCDAGSNMALANAVLAVVFILSWILINIYCTWNTANDTGLSVELSPL
jgi:hypothetical protein